MSAMVIKSEFGIYKVLEKHLKDALGKNKREEKPLTCVDLFEFADVKQYAKDANKVSDYLGHMWRRGLLNRFYAPKTSTSFARYAYTWKTESDDADPAKPINAPRRTATHPNIEVREEDGAAVITFPDFTITIKPRT